MKTIMLYTASGPLVILTSYDSPTAPDLLRGLKVTGITKFIASDIPRHADLLGGLIRVGGRRTINPRP